MTVFFQTGPDEAGCAKRLGQTPTVMLTGGKGHEKIIERRLRVPLEAVKTKIIRNCQTSEKS